MKRHLNIRLTARERGFTLIELIASIAIISIIAVLAINRYQGVILSGQEAKQNAVIKAVETAKEQFVADEKTTNAKIVAFNSLPTWAKLKNHLSSYMTLNGGTFDSSALLEGTGKTTLDVGMCKAMASGSLAATASTPATLK